MSPTPDKRAGPGNGLGENHDNEDETLGAGSGAMVEAGDANRGLELVVVVGSIIENFPAVVRVADSQERGEENVSSDTNTEMETKTEAPNPRVLDAETAAAYSRSHVSLTSIKFENITDIGAPPPKHGFGSKYQFGSIQDLKKQRTILLPHSETKDQHEGKTYHEDVWHLIAKFLDPEAVSKFARLCKGSYGVTKQASFWRQLYRRYYDPEAAEEASLPPALQPDSIARPYGLKTAVVRSLFYLYTPFVNRLNDERAKGKEPFTLAGLSLHSFWNFKVNKHTYVYFKLCDSFAPVVVVSPEAQIDPLLKLDDIEANSEKEFKVLQIVCGEDKPYIPGTIYGESLLSVKVSLSRNYLTSTMDLVFGPLHLLNACRPEKLSLARLPEGCICVTVKGVKYSQVLDYWNPRYPHKDHAIPSDTLRPEEGEEGVVVGNVNNVQAQALDPWDNYW